MDTEDLNPLVEDLTSNIDDLEEAVAPLLRRPLSHSTSKLPLLDKAKLYVLATYAIESILFSCLRLNGVDAKSHPVFQELSRVKEYFAKIKTAETAGTMRSTTLDKEAASRFIKHGLAGNEKYDRQRAERLAREKAGAKRKLEDMQVGTHTRFDGAAKRIKAAESEQNYQRTINEDGAAEAEDNETGTATTDAGTDEHDPSGQRRKTRPPKKRKGLSNPNITESLLALDEGGLDGVPNGSADGESMDVADSSRKAPTTNQEALEALLHDSVAPDEKKSKRKRKKKSKGQALEDERADEMK